MPVSDLASEPVVAVSPSTPVPTLADRMLDENVGCVVVTRHSRPVGIVTDRELALSLTDAFDVTALDAVDVMDEDIAAIHDDDCVLDALRAMNRTTARQAAVVNDARRLVGLLTLDELVATMSEELSETIAAVGQSTR